MTFSTDAFLTAATSIAYLALSVAICLSTIRLAIGPSLPDRVVALDMVGILLVGLFLVFGIRESQPDAIRAATVLALINFIGTVGFAVYTTRRVSE
jgi:multicomponent Na+:H+ antiporter subunit F